MVQESMDEANVSTPHTISSDDEFDHDLSGTYETPQVNGRTSEEEEIEIISSVNETEIKKKEEEEKVRLRRSNSPEIEHLPTKTFGDL